MRKLFVVLGFCLVSAACLEISTNLYFFWRIRTHKLSSESVKGFLLARVFLPDSNPRPKLAGQKFIGELTPESPNWAEMLPADILLSWRVGKNVAALWHPATAFPYTDAGYWYVTNSQGFASTGESGFFFPKKKPAGSFRVIVVGGSTVFGVGSRLPGENLPAMLKKELGSLTHGKLEVINAGVPAYLSIQELLYLEFELAQYEPDLVVVYDGWNDFELAVGRKQDDEPRLMGLERPEKSARLNATYDVLGSAKLFAETLRARLRYLEKTFFRRFAFPSLVRERLSGPVDLWDQYDGSQRGAMSTDEASEVLRSNWEEMIHLAQKRGFRIGLFLQPAIGIGAKTLSKDENSYRSNVGDERLTQLKAFYEKAQATIHSMAIANRNPDACIADLSTALDGEMGPVYVDRIHLNARGNEVIAQNIVDRLRKCGALGKRARAKSY